MLTTVLCESCGEGTLRWEEREDGTGFYICENWQNCSVNEDCARPVDEETYTELEREANFEVGRNLLAEKLAPSSAKSDTKQDNITALTRGDIPTKREPMHKVLQVSQVSAVARQPFKSPVLGAQSNTSKDLLRRLASRHHFVPWGSSQPFRPLNINIIGDPEIKTSQKSSVTELPPGIEPLVLWQPEESEASSLRPVIVDPHVTRFLRAHQREGVQFMFECVSGLRSYTKPDGQKEPCYGCILADDMGLGKTLQSIALLWTCLEQGLNGGPLVKRAIVVCPTSLVSNWESEFKKWLEDRVNVIALCDSARPKVMESITNFLAPRSIYRVLIISYETFRIHAERLQKPGGCDLLICDEAHRLKNDKTRINQALGGLQCKRRVLLSGTPMQNDLEEFYAMVDFTNPGVLGNAQTFRKKFQTPIIAGREPDATDLQRTLSAEQSNVLSETVNLFILRRTNALLSKHLPPKLIQVLCCKMTDLQIQLYNHFVNLKVDNMMERDNKLQVLASITMLKKLCNHPKLIYDTVKRRDADAAAFKDCLHLFPPAVLNPRNGSWTGGDGLWIELSGKMSVLAKLLSHIRRTTDDRIVLVSNFTQTLDLFTQLCRERGYPAIRLDGSTNMSKRQKSVQRFNDPRENEFAFLLSSKAGGCGLNLIGGNRLVLFDPDWNPATDKQAAARVWRDGQKKRVYIYRFLSSGTIEEKVFQRQISKEGLQKVVDGEKATDSKNQVNLLSSEDLRDLFTLRLETSSDTHDTLLCKRCGEDGEEGEEGEGGQCEGTEEGGVSGKAPDSKEACNDIGGFAAASGVADKLESHHRQIGSPLEEELQEWGHHTSCETVPDVAMQQAGGSEVSFVFTCQIDGQLKPQASKAPAASRGNSLAPCRAHAESNRKSRGSRAQIQALLPPAPPPSATPTNRVAAAPFAGPPRVATWQELNNRGPTTPSPMGRAGRPTPMRPLAVKRGPEAQAKQVPESTNAAEAHLKRNWDEGEPPADSGRRVSLRHETQVSKPAPPNGFPAARQVSAPLQGRDAPLSSRQEADTDSMYLLNFAPTQPNPDETGMPKGDDHKQNEVDPMEIATWAAARGSIGNQPAGESDGAVGEQQKKVISLSEDESSAEEGDEGEDYTDSGGEMESDDE